jgi:hypothetical protein
MSGSHAGWDIVYPNWDLLCFSSVPTGTFWDISIMPQLLPFKSFSIHQSPCHSAVIIQNIEGKKAIPVTGFEGP